MNQRHQGVVEIVGRLIEKNIFPFLATNGTRLQGRLGRKLADVGLKYIQVSLDTVDRRQFRKLTGVDQLPKVLQGITELIAANIAVGVKAVITRVNISNLTALVERCRDLGVRKVTFDIYSPSEMGGKDERLFVDPLQYEKALQIIETLQQRYNHDLIISPFRKIPRWKSADSIIHCAAFLGSLTINPWGEIIVCDQFDDPRLRPGNVSKRPIARIWNSPEMQRAFASSRTCRSIRFAGNASTSANARQAASASHNYTPAMLLHRIRAAGRQSNAGLMPSIIDRAVSR